MEMGGANPGELAQPASRESPWAAWARAASEPELMVTLAELAGAGSGREVGAVAGLRRRWPREVVEAGLNIARARAKAVLKMPPELAGRLIADVPGVEMASSWPIAAWKARRLIADDVGPRRPVLDLCSGVGGDTVALASNARGAGVACVAVDLDPVRAWMAGTNAGVEWLTADVSVTATLDALAARWPSAVVHVDPARRDEAGGGGRRLRLEDLQPGLPTLRAIVDRFAGVAIKLGPGVEAAELARQGLSGELEVIGQHGELKQAVLWTGIVSGGDGVRRATMVRGDGEAVTVRGREGTAPTMVVTGEIGAWLYEPDAALSRAGLLWMVAEEHGLAEPAGGLRLLTGGGPVRSAWLRGFEVCGVMPWRERAVRAWLREHGAGLVEVKTRGGAVDPDRVQQELRGEGSEAFVVFVLRVPGSGGGNRMVAAVCRRESVRSGGVDSSGPL